MMNSCIYTHHIHNLADTFQTRNKTNVHTQYGDTQEFKV